MSDYERVEDEPISVRVERLQAWKRDQRESIEAFRVENPPLPDETLQDDA